MLTLKNLFQVLIDMYNYFKTIFISFFVLLSTSPYAVTFPKLEHLIKKGQFSLAYQQAIKLRSDNEGDPRFDYLYGLSASKTGHYNEAVFALDRVTVNTPNVIRPRLELARAYLLLNNKSAAVKEFNDVLNLSPPPIVRKKVLSYLAELDKKQDKVTQRSLTKRIASFSIGYDDNINFGYDGDEIELPNFGTFVLDSSSVKQSSGFAEAKLQIKRRTLKNQSKSTFVLANLTHRKYFKKTDFDRFDLDLRAGTTINRKDKQYQFVARLRPVMFDSNLQSNTWGLDAIARKAIRKGTIVSAKLSLEKYDNKELSLSDRSRVILSGRLDKQVAEIKHQLNLYFGKEFPDKSSGKQFSRDISGVGYWGVKEWNERNRTYLGLDYRHYKHLDNYPVFSKNRVDDRIIFKAGHEWQVSDKATLVLSAKHINNKSNLDLYDSKRNEVKVGIRYDLD